MWVNSSTDLFVFEMTRRNSSSTQNHMHRQTLKMTFTHRLGLIQTLKGHWKLDEFSVALKRIPWIRNIFHSSLNGTAHLKGKISLICTFYKCTSCVHFSLIVNNFLSSIYTAKWKSSALQFTHAYNDRTIFPHFHFHTFILCVEKQIFWNSNVPKSEIVELNLWMISIVFCKECERSICTHEYHS